MPEEVSYSYSKGSLKVTLAFTSTSSADGSAYSAYYIIPQTIAYNPELRWQKNQQAEIGFDIDLAGNKISLAAYYNRTLDAYRLSNDYERFTYNYTSIESLNACPIPAENRRFTVDRNTGIVTVSDVTGASEDVTLAYSEIVPEVTSEPDYKAALAAVAKLA